MLSSDIQKRVGCPNESLLLMFDVVFLIIVLVMIKNKHKNDMQWASIVFVALTRIPEAYHRNLERFLHDL